MQLQATPVVLFEMARVIRKSFTSGKRKRCSPGAPPVEADSTSSHLYTYTPAVTSINDADFIRYTLLPSTIKKRAFAHLMFTDLLAVCSSGDSTSVQQKKDLLSKYCRQDTQCLVRLHQSLQDQ
jgi:hypothetical protein